MHTLQLKMIAISLLAFATNAVVAQRVNVEAANQDISYSLDLKAVASVFGESDDLQDFEYRINRYDAGISNLDINGDGVIDYLRVVNTSENRTHVIVLQAVLDKDVYQDVATIVVERDRYRRLSVQLVGASFIYGHNYIIEPVFYRTPRIVSWFWSPRFQVYHSPYYWGNYPRYYRYRNPVHVDIYLSHIHSCIHHQHRFRYATQWHSPDAYRVFRTVTRNDFSVRYPDRHYSKRVQHFSNRYEMDQERRATATRTSENRSVRADRSTTYDNRAYTGSRESTHSNASQNGSRTANNETRPQRGYRTSESDRDSRSSRNNEITTPSRSENRSSNASIRSSQRNSGTENASSRGSNSTSRNSSSSTSSRAPESGNGQGRR